MDVKILILAAALALSGCVTTAKGSFCEISSPIRLSASAIAALSDAEVKVLLAHNRKGEKLCRWTP
jgi:outer membrane murein-binding lipoprotein Lpp